MLLLLSFVNDIKLCICGWGISENDGGDVFTPAAHLSAAQVGSFHMCSHGVHELQVLITAASFYTGWV